MLQRSQSREQQSQGEGEYVVKQGDNPYSIARSNGIALMNLLAANGLHEQSLIHPGDTLTLPGQGESTPSQQSSDQGGGQRYSVQEGDTLWEIAERFGVSLNSLQTVNSLSNPNFILPNQTLVIPGIDGGSQGGVQSSARSQPESSRNNASRQSSQQTQSTQKDPAVEKEKHSQSANGYNAALGKALAMAGSREAGGKRRAGGYCYRHVANAVDRVIGRFLSGMHAYMAASQLAARKDLFVETSAGNLSSLPAGAIVVWGKGSSESGHISIAMGNGMEVSDFIGQQMTYHYGGASARVFLPKARM